MSKDFRKELVKLVKASGQEVIDRAEDLVGNGDMMVDFSINLIFSIDGQLVDECPLIEVKKSHVSKNALDVLRKPDEDYTPVCPRGYVDCIHDPAYIKHTAPDWYKELYGDLTPAEAIHTRGDCYDLFKEDPNMDSHCYRYDDEDK
jgi:hypothetical protein